MCMALRAKNKLGFIAGIIPAPPSTSSNHEQKPGNGQTSLHGGGPKNHPNPHSFAVSSEQPPTSNSKIEGPTTASSATII
ncbi:hypothetical protein WN944_018593 [Citrus x changshan-huyou]|uniref:Uncharacterized protein n=1 Tax=Citrus x changshan-huyou TaxID=2935761 RepID=A0AAP0LUP4_9ROSI